MLFSQKMLRHWFLCAQSLCYVRANRLESIYCCPSVWSPAALWPSLNSICSIGSHRGAPRFLAQLIDQHCDKLRLTVELAGKLEIAIIATATTLARNDSHYGE